MRPSTAMFAMLCAITMTSCIGDDGDGDPSNYVEVTQIKAAYKDAACTYYAACGLFPSKEACIGAELQNLGVTFQLDANVVAAIGAGRVYYNGSNVKACFDALAARSCDKTSESYRVTIDACRNVLTGTQLGGATCTIDEECVSQTCSTGNQGSSCGMGTCIGDTAPTFMPGQVGENCQGSGSGCVAGAYCDTTGTCALLKAVGETCNLASECTYGLSCVGTTGSRTCGALPALGESCSTDGICRDEGNWCNFSTGNCEQVGTASASCSSSSSACSQFYPCDFTTSTCEQGPGLGESCDSFSNKCFAAGTFCDPNTSTCVGLKSNGMDCNSDSECQSDYCDQSMSTPLCGTPTVCF